MTLWGISTYNYPPNYSQIQTDSATLGHRPDVIHNFQDWGYSDPGDWGTWNFSTWVTDTIGRGQIPLITWEAMGNGKSYSPANIAAGQYDAYLNTYANGAASLPGKPEIWIRLFHEFNDPPGTAYPWQSWTASQYISAWKHIHDLFVAAGATNVKWVWNIDGWEGQDIPSLKAKYPGDAYVDYVGWDQYEYNPFGTGNALDAMAQIAPSKPIVVPELGASDGGYADYKALMDGIVAGQTPNIHCVCYFDMTSGGDWQFGDNPNLTAYTKGALASPAFSGGTPPPPPPPTKHTTRVTNAPVTITVQGVARKGTVTGTFTWTA